MEEKQLLDFLKARCPGQEYAMTGKELGRVLKIGRSELRRKVNRLRSEGYLIGSSRKGYFYILTFGEAQITIDHLDRMIRGLEAARRGLLRGMANIPVWEAGGGCHR